MRILVVDRLPLIHEAIRALLGELEGGCQVVGAADQSAARAALDAVPDLSLAVIEVPEEASQASLDFIARLHAGRESLPILALGAADGRARAARAIAAGACGYVPKTAPAAALLAATRLALSGGAAAPAGGVADSARRLGSVAEARIARAGPRARLTARQSEVLALMAEGKPNKLICRELKLSEGTVKVHVSAVLRALKVANRTQAALAAAGVDVSAQSGGGRPPAVHPP